MTLWVLMALMCLVAIIIVALPLYRESKRLTPSIAGVIIVLVALSAGLYAYQGRPDVPSGRSTGAAGGQNMNDAIASLAERLRESPNDADGWSMLGRSYLSVQDFANAVNAFEHAVVLEESKNAQTLVSLGEALVARDNAPIGGRTATLFETAISLDPLDQKALFYSGIAAANRGDMEVAIERWERLQTLNPPPEIQSILSRQIAEWSGEPPPAAVEPTPAPAPMPEPQPVAEGDAVVTANIGLSSDAAADLTSEAIVFIIARDPAAPSPPIAVARRLLSQLPATVSLSDAESMVQGRNLSSFEEFEILVRVSLSGQPVAQPGDWYTAAVVRPADQPSVDLTIDQRVE